MINVVFMGTPEFAVPSLDALHADGRYRITGVITQPDRPAGRGRQLTPSAVRTRADALGLPVQTPKSLRKPEAFEALAALQPDLIVVAAFGQILRPRVLDLPRFGCINVHASLLPRHRGAAPIAAAIQAGDAETGVTIMKMDAGLDTGPMLTTRALPIRPDHTTGTLTETLATLGADLLVESLPGYLAGAIHPQPQPDDGATYAPMLTKEDGRLEFSRPAVNLERQVRAMQPWPGAFALLDGQPLKVIAARVLTGDAAPGQVVRSGKQIAVGTGDGLLGLVQIQPPGKKVMPALAFANGNPAFIGAHLT